MGAPLRCFWSLVAASLATIPAALSLAASPPNILLMVSDDQGYGDLGVINSTIQTPSLDRLAGEGVRLTNFYVAWPACTPSRASLLTGRYPQRNGISDMIRNEAPDFGYRYPAAEYEVTFERVGGMDEREVILPAALAPSGFVSGIYGKWDLGSLKRFLPTSRGFQDFFGFVNTGIDYYTHERYGVPSMFRNGSPTAEGKGRYCTELFRDEALRFLREEAGKRPFFLYVPFNAPHNSSSLDPKIRTTVQAPKEYRDRYPAVATEFQVQKKARYGDGKVEVVTPAARRRDYCAAVTCMDAAIGDLLKELDRKGLTENTIVIFLSDNGGSGGADNSPLRGHKSQTWEGGIRVPCLVRWPGGGIPAGAVNAGFLSSLEIFPSLLKATGTPFPSGVVLDGLDWWDCLRGKTPSPRQEMFWKRRDQLGARVGDWKWVEMRDGGSGLFDLASDPGEKEDLSQKRPEDLKRVKARFDAWTAAMENAEPRGPFRDF